MSHHHLGVQHIQCVSGNRHMQYGLKDPQVSVCKYISPLAKIIVEALNPKRQTAKPPNSISRQIFQLYRVRQTGRQSYLVVSEIDGSSGPIPETISAAPYIVVGVVHLVVVVMVVCHPWQLATRNNPGSRGKAN